MSNAIKIESETVKRIREMFPKPKRCGVSRDDPDAYCVLGALFKYARLFVPDLLMAVRPPLNEKLTGVKKTQYLDSVVDAFPTSTYPVELLQKMNCSLDRENAQQFASDVMSLNDHGKFGQAWGKLSEALIYSPEEGCQ